MIIVFGSSGHAKEIASILRATSCRIDYFVTADEASADTHGPQIISDAMFFDMISKSNKEANVYMGIGDSTIRRKLVEKIKFKLQNVAFPNLCHPAAIFLESNTLEMGEGNIFFPNVVVSTNVVIADHNHFNISTTISHDCTIGSFNSFSPLTSIAGKVAIGDGNFFGINSAVINNIVVANNMITGAGATVIRNLEIPGTYAGVPIRKIK